MRKITLLVATLLTATLLFAGCSKSESTEKEIKVGYFPNLSHAPAMVGIEKGYYQEELKDYKIETSTFPNGSLFMDALSTGQIDIGYVGPGPVINRYLQGGDVVVIANSTIGENVLVVRNDVDFNGLKDLEGRIVATPSTGCTHDLLLRKMLKEQGLAVEENGGTIERLPQKPATMMGLFEQKQIDAALVSEPWASLMEAKGVARVVVDAYDLPWEGNVPATVLVVKKDFLEKNPEAVENFIKAHEKSIDFIQNNRQETTQLIVKQIKDITGQETELDIIESAFDRVTFISQIDEDIFQAFADLTKELGFIEGDSDIKDLIN
ncbi:aliphatic sulfonate ABC transporter substrate-binding protein [Mobilitalea sibirica]|uniref:Aliphatic sulfonate ABC transporter substrate-binding protein n=1 Tax=Mobilitalea sibirica TaxID=1462919 RepID=A0A8J7HCY0_9FIRM|nr:aliphatic sulfonate ABC transporter substrate-binding protein [Mobilitalea sibirica]MBH1942521.1 aliphatic sulfonate ABC transporter substrate-binding protein [Mobilitalea sibirica]